MAKKLSPQSKEPIWIGKKCILGLPLSFTRYTLYPDKLILAKGTLKQIEDELLLYRIRDIRHVRTLGERIFGVGTIVISADDITDSVLQIRHVRQSREVKDLISLRVEEEKERIRKQGRIFSPDVQVEHSSNPSV